MNSLCEANDLLVFSHLRWDFTLQRPQHLMIRYAKFRRVFYFEKPVLGMTDVPRIHMKETPEGVNVVIPYLPSDIGPDSIQISLKELVDELVFDEQLTNMTLWYYSPSSVSFSTHLGARAIIYDCTKEISPDLENIEAQLLERANLVFTSNEALYEKKKKSHPNVHSFTDCVDYGHFSQARLPLVEPDDQVNIPRPRVGLYGAIDENLNLDLLEQMAQRRPNFQFIVVGPLKNIDTTQLPQKQNIFYLGEKDYNTIPLYLSGWDCAIVPLKIGGALTPDGPARIPEYLASGTPVVMPPIEVLRRFFDDPKLVSVAYSADGFINSIERALHKRRTDPEWMARIDSALASISWESTFQQMARLESEMVLEREFAQ